MKILHFGKFYPPFHGGMEVYLKDLAEQQAKTSQVIALVHNHKFKLLFSPIQIEKNNNVKIIRQKTLKPILFTPIMFGTNKVVSQLIEDQQVDVIHISWPNPSALFLLLSKKAKTKPWVIQWQSDMVTKHSSALLKFAYLFFKPFERLLLNQSKKIIASTQEYANYSNVLLNYKDKLSYIPLALKVETRKHDKESLEWAKKQWNGAKQKIYTIGRLTFYKNHELLIKTAELMPDVQFLITGSGDLETKLTNLILKKRLKNIKLTGSLNNQKLDALLYTCDAFCLPSNDRAESYGMVLLEALQLNKTILVSNLKGSGMRWIAEQSPQGYSFDCNDEKDLAEKIKQIYQTKTSTKQSKIQTFNIENCANTIDKVYQSIT